MDEFVDEARLAHPWLPDDGYHLAMPCTSPLQGLLQALQLVLPSHEAREPPRRAGPRQLEDLYWLGQALDGKLPQGVDLDEPLGKAEGRRRQSDTARGGGL